MQKKDSAVAGNNTIYEYGYYMLFRLKTERVVLGTCDKRQKTRMEHEIKNANIVEHWDYPDACHGRVESIWFIEPKPATKE